MEWVGLLLLVALALGAAVAHVPRVEGRSLGAAVAQRIVCAAGGACVRAAAGAGPARAAGGAPGAAVAGTPPAAAPPARAGPRAAAGRHATAGRRATAGLTGARRVAGAGARRIVGTVAKRAWIACLGYRRYRYERSHPGRLSPLDPIPLEEGLATANACLNPLGFLGDD